MKKIRLFYFLILLFFISCGNDIELYTKELSPRLANNLEVVKAITHYKHKGETQKIKALLFLLKNIDGHYAVSNVLSKEYDSILSPKEFGGQLPANETKYGIALQKLIVLEEKYKGIKSTLTKIRYDNQVLVSDYLIENIDASFEVWKKSPWAKDLSFDDFCETILPYRADREPIHHWRKKAYENFSWVMKTNPQIDRISACSIINDSLKKVLSNMIEMNMYPKRLTYDKMYKFKLGICEDETTFAVLAMRSVGLPVGIDFVPQWPWRSMGHSWNYLLLEDGRTVPFMGTETNPKVPHFEKDKKGKVFRKTFSKQETTLAQIEKDHSKIPDFFKSPYLKDVTHLYGKTYDVTIPLESPTYGEEKYVYLSVFDNQEWVSVDWAVSKQKEATFKNVEGGIVYLPLYYRQQQFLSAGHPVVVNEKGEATQLIPNKDKTQTLKLKRKYPLHKRMDDYLKNMIGGRIELSNHADFRKPYVMATIEAKPKPYLRTIKAMDTIGKYKYIRYLSSAQDSGRCNVAIFNVYGRNNRGSIKLKGELIGTNRSYRGYGAEKRMAFDDDPSTFFDAPEEEWGKAWVGLKFEEPSAVFSVDFMPRNDTNTIFEGQEYELFYWDKGWQGLGKKIANDSRCISFEKVPLGALYLLHNYSGGNEERIFKYENGKVHWY